MPDNSDNVECSLFKDVWDAVLNDGWMWVVVWGKQRGGKTTVQMKTAFNVYKDWDQVLQSFAFNLSGILYKIKNGIPCRIMTRNLLHERVPIVLPDDFGAQCNKAKIQHEPAWDIFKGAFDTLATKVSVLMASMPQPSEATQQIQEKYTHEVFVVRKGFAKYDKVDWQQNFNGWQARQDKDWQQEFTFTPVPVDVYKEYDEMRLSLVDELLQLIDDSMIENEGLKVFRRLTDKDVELIEKLQTEGQISDDWFKDPVNESWREVLKRCKARSIVVPVKIGNHDYRYDLTDFGFNLYTLIQTQKNKGIVLPESDTTKKATLATVATS